MRIKYLASALVAAFLSASSLAAIPSTESTELVEFYNKSLDHYFVTVGPKEIEDLDSGKHPGWERTGYRYLVVKGGSTLAGSVPVCRFYGKPEAGLDSHFYSAKVSECQDVIDKFSNAWQLEANEVFRAFLVDPLTGKCPVDAAPVYRLWNQRPDVNHRYTDQLTVYQEMVAKSYKAEGDGNPAQPVAFCGVAGGSVVPAPPAGSPSCTITASANSPTVGATLTLDAVCTGTPTSHVWAGCTSTTSQCKTTQTTAGAASYSVKGTNAAGTGAPVSLTVNWQAVAGAVPQCTISGTSSTPATGGTLVLSSNCSQTPTSRQWLECNYLVQQICNPIVTCSPTAQTCAVSKSSPGFARYAVAGINSAGTGPRATMDVEWVGGGGGTPPPPPVDVPSCTVIASNPAPVIGNTLVLSASCSGSPTSFTWSGVTCSQIQCATSSPTAGPQTYSVTAGNSAGSGNPASLTVQWQSSPAPVCNLVASNPSPTVGQTITITSSCTGNPTSYAWSGCTGSGSSCTDAANIAVAKPYTLTASNDNGAGPPASVVVDWQAPATAPPVCTLTPSSPSAFVGAAVTLTASCSNNPTSYAWTNCNSTSSTCAASAAAAGVQSYSVTATNGFGTSAPAPADVTWQVSTGGGDFCSAYPNVNRLTKDWGDNSPIYTQSNGGFAGDGVVVVTFVAPAAPASYALPGSTQVAEFNGPPTSRQVTISSSACDFRTPDPTGASGPFTVGYGNSATANWNVGAGSAPLVPGQTYHANIRNWSPDLNANLCTQSACNAIIQFNWPQ